MQNHFTVCSFLIAFPYSVKVMRFLVYICNQQRQLTVMRSRTFLYYKQVKCIKIFISLPYVFLFIYGTDALFNNPDLPCTAG